MTPNPDSPIFIKNEVPEYACDNSKMLSQLFFRLREEILNNRWNGLSSENISLNYKVWKSDVEFIEIVFNDCNKHNHHFCLQLTPDKNGFGDIGCILRYDFEGFFGGTGLVIRSFAKYLLAYLQYEGFEPKVIDCGKALFITCPVEYAYDGMCKLIDITLSHLKPLVWFYTMKPCINTFEEACYYLAGVKSSLQLESVKGRWNNISPKCFKLVKYEAEREVSLALKYIVDDVWELSLSVDIADCDDYFDMFCSFRCYPNGNLSSCIKKQLNTLFAEFLNTLKLPQGNIYVGGGCGKDHSVNIQYFYIEDTFGIACSKLDEIVPALQNYNFQLPLKTLNLTGEIEAVKEQMEAALNTTLEVVTEEEQINKKLQCGYFLH